MSVMWAPYSYLSVCLAGQGAGQGRGHGRVGAK